MREIEFSADELVFTLLKISERQKVCLLDSCGVSNLGSHLLIAGIEPLETLNITNDNPEKTLEIFNEKLSQPDLACIFTISYDFGLKLQNIPPRPKEFPAFPEPDIFLAQFDCLIIHDYNTEKTCLTGNENRFDEIEKLLSNTKNSLNFTDTRNSASSIITLNFTRKSYVAAVEKIQECIRRGDTYQTNLTQQIRAQLNENLSAQEIFRRLRSKHPAAFAAFIKRENDFVVSVSPERFIQIKGQKENCKNEKGKNKFISASPIKGTRRRGKTAEEDSRLKTELETSEKDRAENVMIVDLLRNDIGRICKFGTVAVEKLCDLETHPTLFHLVSTIKGELRETIKFSDIIKAVFPCGSITGAPKIRTMQIIDELETAARGLSMGAIGYNIMENGKWITENEFDMSVAIRTMVIRGGEAIFNVGGGIVIDSVPEDEYEESLLKAKALLAAINGKLE